MVITTAVGMELTFLVILLKNRSGKGFREDEDHTVLFTLFFFSDWKFVTDMLEQTSVLAFQISGEGSENSGYGLFWSFFS